MDKADLQKVKEEYRQKKADSAMQKLSDDRVAKEDAAEKVVQQLAETRKEAMTETAIEAVNKMMDGPEEAEAVEAVDVVEEQPVKQPVNVKNLKIKLAAIQKSRSDLEKEQEQRQGRLETIGSQESDLIAKIVEEEDSFGMTSWVVKSDKIISTKPVALMGESLKFIDCDDESYLYLGEDGEADNITVVIPSHPTGRVSIHFTSFESLIKFAEEKQLVLAADSIKSRRDEAERVAKDCEVKLKSYKEILELVEEEEIKSFLDQEREEVVQFEKEEKQKRQEAEDQRRKERAATAAALMTQMTKKSDDGEKEVVDLDGDDAVVHIDAVMSLRDMEEGMRRSGEA